jgi:osmotically-inducible protein OsmY
MPHPSRRLSPSLDSAGASTVRPSLFDSRDEFIERVSPIGMAAIYFGAFSLAPQDAALSRQALFKLSFAFRYFLQPNGLKVAVQRQTAILSGTLALPSLAVLADILSRQIEGITEVSDETQPAAPGDPDSAPVSAKDGEAAHEMAQLLFATDQTLRSGVKVTLEEGKLVLDGEVSSQAQKSWAESLVTGVGGELHSSSKLVLIAAPNPAVKPPDVDDESLQALILLRLRMVGETEHLPLRVKANRGVVSLQGKVRSEALRQRVENLARSTVGLRELRSALTIAA